MINKVEKWFGPPGTGKTTKLIEKVVDLIKSGTEPKNIGYFSFTNKATDEAKGKIQIKFPQYSLDEEFQGFRTLHSLAYQCLSSRLKIISEEQARAFDKDFYIENIYMRENDPTSMVVRAKHIVIDAASTARARLLKFDDYLLSIDSSDRYRLNKWLNYPAKECDRNFSESDILKLLEFNEKFESYKKALGVIDYTAIIEEACENFESIPSYDLLIIDEAQDLSKLQWKFAKMIIEKSKKVFIAGDDDQAICESFGAYPQEFLEIPGHEIVLNESHRVPKNIYNKLMEKNGVVSILENRYKRRKKEWNPNPKIEGCYQIINNVDELIKLINNSQESKWIIMAATHATLSGFSRILRENKINHFLSNQLISDVASSSNFPFVILKTIWGEKGGEAENAVLLTGGYADKKMLENDPRLKYVAITRASKNFYECIF
jgi:superfamily I DNA/RNA helicase